MSDRRIRPFVAADVVRVQPLLERALGSRFQARRGELIDVLTLPGFVADDDGAPVGLLTYQRRADECELVAIAAEPGQGGVGSALLDALKAETADCRRIWLITTNDNLDALRFYQRRGFVLAALYPGAVDRWRAQLKPSIPTVGAYGIPLRDELELEYRPPTTRSH